MDGQQASWAAIGLGGNLGDPVQTLTLAKQWLDTLPDTRVLAHSALYRSRAIGPGDQPDYANAAAVIATGLDPGALLAALQALELRAGRERLVRWGARTLDLDILLFERLCSDDPQLTLPHPRLCERDFVLRPLNDIAPNWRLPDGRRVADAAAGAGSLPCWTHPAWPVPAPLAIPARLSEDDGRTAPLPQETA